MDFETLQTALTQSAASSGAAEAHGTLCGAVCSGTDREPDWLLQVLGESDSDDAAVRECRRLLEMARDDARRQLASFDMDFVPLLPTDAQPLAQRVEALGFWCQGFLFGLSLGRSRELLDHLPGEAGEVIHDLAEITRAGIDAGAGDEADEQAYAELVEYLRVAAQILYEELNPVAAASSAPDQRGTVH
ncbi:MAG TPA: UPF0149 family protein [Gammaproteobacteria bacterium]|nr:UPF0149 family protein [Gammaproteobacteria bacterium]